MGWLERYAVKIPATFNERIHTWPDDHPQLISYCSSTSGETLWVWDHCSHPRGWHKKSGRFAFPSPEAFPRENWFRGRLGMSLAITRGGFGAYFLGPHVSAVEPSQRWVATQAALSQTPWKAKSSDLLRPTESTTVLIWVDESCFGRSYWKVSIAHVHM